MPLSDWLANRWIVTHSASVQEITDLFAVVDRDLTDAATPLPEVAAKEARDIVSARSEDVAPRLESTGHAPYVA